MEYIILALFIYLIVTSCICLLICVNPNDPRLLGRMSNFLYKKLPPIFYNLTKKLFGQKGISLVTRFKVYLLQTNHPLVQILYLVIAIGGFVAYQILGIWKHMPNRYIGNTHIILANLLALVCFWTYYKSCSVSPGVIKKHNQNQIIDKFQQHYDELLYKKNSKCKTCIVAKPARSRHCQLCQMCVSKFDHHCVWIRQCVGQKNYKYFIALLLSHAIFCTYLAVIGTVSLYDSIDRMGFMRMSFKMNGQIVPASLLLAVQYLFMTETVFFLLIIMCLIMGFTLLILVSYHFYLISQDQTANQRLKINEELEYLKKQILKLNITYKDIQTEQQTKNIQYNHQHVTLQELFQYKSQCHRRLAFLQKSKQTQTFIKNLADIYKL